MATIDITSGVTSTGLTLNDYDTLNISHGGMAVDTTAEKSYLYVFSGGSAEKTTLNSGGRMYLSSGGKVNNTTVNSSGFLDVEFDCTADNTTVNFSGRVSVDSGGRADNTKVNSGGYLGVYSGARATEILENGGFVFVGDGAKAKFIPNDISGLTLENASATVHSGTTAVNITVNYCGELHVCSDGIATRISVQSGGDIFVSSGGTVNDTSVNSNGSLAISSGGKADRTTVNSDGYLGVSSGGTAEMITVNSYGRMTISVDGTATEIVENGGYVSVGTGATATFKANKFSGLVLDNDSATVHSGTTAERTTVNSGGYLYVYAGGKVNSATLNSKGYLDVYAGGKATDVAVSSGGWMGVYAGGTADKVTVKSGGSLSVSSGGRVTVNSGGAADNVTVGSGGSMTVSRGTATNVTVSSGGSMSVDYHATADHITVFSSGSMKVSGTADNVVLSGGSMDVTGYGATADHTTVSSGGMMEVRNSATATTDVTVVNGGGTIVFSGGMLTNATVLTNGVLDVNSGGILTGSMTFAADATVTLYDGACVVFDISGLTADECANPFLNDYSDLKLIGDQSWKIAVSAVQEFGTYALADWASGFSGTIKVLDENGMDTGVALTVGSTTEIFGAAHTLNLVNETLVLTVNESENMDPADTGWNDTLYDKKTKTLNRSVYGMDALVVGPDTKEILVDTAGTVRALDNLHNFIGNSESGKLDAADFTKIELATAAKLSFNIYSGQAAKFNVWSLTEGKDKTGATTYTMKSLQSATLKGGYAGISTSKKPLLLEAGTYYVSMELSNAKKASEEGYYNVTIDDSPSATEFYTRADNSDDWDDMKTAGPNGRCKRIGTITEDSFADMLVSDGWVGFSDAVDYMQFTLESAARLGFYLDATDATKFTIWQLNEKKDKNGVPTYSLKSLQSVTLKKQGDSFYWADTSGKPLILSAGMYYMSMESTNAKKGGSASYDISLSGAVFYDRADNSDDWDDMKTAGDFGLVGDVGTITGNGMLLEDWVGYGDAVDYKRFTLNRKTNLSFSVFSEDEAKFTVWELAGKGGKGGTSYSLKSLGTMKIGAVGIGQLSLNFGAGDYYFSMESTNAKKGGSAAYTVEVEGFNEFDSLSAALAMPEADGLAMTDALSFGGLETDALADASAFDKLAALDDASAWQSLLA